MRYLTLFSVALLLFSAPLRAQRFSAGIVGGAVGSDVDGTDFEDNDVDFHKAGFTGGGFVNAQMKNKKNSFQFEILYVQKGSWQPPDSANNFSYYKLKLDYLEVPLIFRHQLHIQVHSRSTDRFAFEVGPSIGALVHVYQDGLFYQNGMYVSGLFDNSIFKRTELALHAGVSYTFYKNFMFDVRYSNSIIPVMKNDLAFNTFFWKSLTKGDNMVFSFTLRYAFKAGQKEE